MDVWLPELDAAVVDWTVFELMSEEELPVLEVEALPDPTTLVSDVGESEEATDVVLPDVFSPVLSAEEAEGVVEPVDV